jgi:hypothetical protein
MIIRVMRSCGDGVAGVGGDNNDLIATKSTLALPQAFSWNGA